MRGTVDQIRAKLTNAEATAVHRRAVAAYNVTTGRRPHMRVVASDSDRAAWSGAVAGALFGFMMERAHAHRPHAHVRPVVFDSGFTPAVICACGAFSRDLAPASYVGEDRREAWVLATGDAVFPEGAAMELLAHPSIGMVRTSAGATP